MKQVLWHVRVTVLAAAACTLLLGMALLVGRALNHLVIGLDLTNANHISAVHFVAIDVERPLIVSYYIRVPQKSRSEYGDGGIRIVQKNQRVELVEVTYSEADVKTGALTVRMTVIASTTDLLEPDAFDRVGRGENVRWRVYLPESGEVWEAVSGRPRSRLVVRLERHLSDVVWIDEHRFLTAGLDGVALRSLDGRAMPAAAAFDGLLTALGRVLRLVPSAARILLPDERTLAVNFDGSRMVVLDGTSLDIVDRARGGATPLLRMPVASFYLLP